MRNTFRTAIEQILIVNIDEDLTSERSFLEEIRGPHTWDSTQIAAVKCVCVFFNVLIAHLLFRGAPLASMTDEISIITSQRLYVARNFCEDGERRISRRKGGIRRACFLP